MGGEADNIVQSLGLTVENQKKYDEVKKRLEDFFIIKRNAIFQTYSTLQNIVISAFYGKNSSVTEL